MLDYGHSLGFGVSIDPTAADFDSALALARQADRSGLDYLAVQDHAYLPHFLDTWTMLTYLLARTERISVVPDVLNLQLRPPTIVAKAAASLAAMAGGRVQLGVGGGARASAVASMGGLPHDKGDAIAFTDEAVRLLRLALRGGEVSADTRHHHVTGYQSGPIPPGPIEVWIGAVRPKMLAVTGRVADGWLCPLNIHVPPDEVPQRQTLIDQAARTAGRAPREIRRIYNVLGTIGSNSGGQGLVGPVETWIDSLSEWTVGLGFDTFIFWPEADRSGQLRVFADEVVPAVRERVAELRGRR